MNIFHIKLVVSKEITAIFHVENLVGKKMLFVFEENHDNCHFGKTTRRKLFQ